MAEAPLSPLQLAMLRAGMFHVDGSTSARGREAAEDLRRRGLVVCFESGSDEAQYTALNYSVTEAGIAARGLH